MNLRCPFCAVAISLQFTLLLRTRSAHAFLKPLGGGADSFDSSTVT